MYEQVRNQLKLDDGGCPLSSTRFWALINKLDEVMNMVAKEVLELDGQIMDELILLHLNAYDVVLFLYTLDDMQHLMYWTHYIKSTC